MRAGDTEEEYTGSDLDAIEQLGEQPGYHLFVVRVERELERRRLELERTADAIATAECRGKIAALRTVLALRVILRDEIRAAMKESERGR